MCGPHAITALPTAGASEGAVADSLVSNPLVIATLDWLLSDESRAQLPQSILFLIRKLPGKFKLHVIGLVFGSLLAGSFAWSSSPLETRDATAARRDMMQYARYLAKHWLESGGSQQPKSPRIMSINAKLAGVGQALRASAGKIELRPRLSSSSGKVSIAGGDSSLLPTSNRSQITAWQLGDTDRILQALLKCSRSEVTREAYEILDTEDAVDYSKMEELPLLPRQAPPINQRRMYKNYMRLRYEIINRPGGGGGGAAAAAGSTSGNTSLGSPQHSPRAGPSPGVSPRQASLSPGKMTVRSAAALAKQTADTTDYGDAYNSLIVNDMMDEIFAGFDDDSITVDTTGM